VSAVVPNMEQHSHLIYFDWPWTAIVSLQSYNFTYIRLLAKYLRLSRWQAISKWVWVASCLPQHRQLLLQTNTTYTFYNNIVILHCNTRISRPSHTCIDDRLLLGRIAVQTGCVANFNCRLRPN